MKGAEAVRWYELKDCDPKERRYLPGVYRVGKHWYLWTRDASFNLSDDGDLKAAVDAAVHGAFTREKAAREKIEKLFGPGHWR